MKIRTIKYYFYEAFRSVLKNSIMSVASILTVMSSIMIFTLSYCLAVNIDYMMEQLGNSVGISAMISDGASTETINELYTTISGIENVESVQFVSSEEALENFSEALDDTTGILSRLEEDNPLPSSFTISVSGAKNQALVVAELEKLLEQGRGIDKIKNARNIVDAVMAVNQGVRIISTVVVLSLGVLAVVIITNTIRITVNSRRNEIGIMKYVGATDWFIRWPFIIEGMIIGAIGSVIPIIICYLGYDRAIALLTENMYVVKIVAQFQSKAAVFLLLAPIALVLGLLIGTAGSAASVRKYLQV